jgi:predicted metal-dependent hydrolase
MKRRDPQLALRFDAGNADNPWREGAELPYLGGRLVLSLGGSGATAQRSGDTLALSLPPQATPRQIQDRAEAWLREEATRLLQQLIARKSALAGRRAPQLALSFAARGDWIDTRDPECLRCSWRLVEQPLAAIEQTIARAIASLPPEQPALDLFGNTA